MSPREQDRAEQITPEETLKALEGYQAVDVIEYVLTTEPLGERWVLGIEGSIVNLDQGQALAWLAGANAVARRFPRAGL